jgi:hypothetical protein
MRARPPSMPTIAVLALGVLAAGGCGDGDDVCTNASALSSDGGGDGSTDATGVTDGKSGDAAGGQREAAIPETDLAEIRFANWSPDSPAVDFCLAPHGTTSFEGPMLAGLADQIDSAGVVDAGAPVLQFPDVSAYLVVEPRTYDVRIVAAGSPDCSVAVGSDATNLPPLTIGTFSTIAFMGALNPTEGEPSLEVTAFLDTTSSSLVDVRFINAAANSGPVAFGFGAPLAGFASLFPDVPFGQAGTFNGEVTDAEEPPSQTFVGLNPLAGATATIPNDARTESLVSATGVYAASGSVLTFVLVGPLTGVAADGGLPDAFLVCVDNAGTVGLLSSCQLLTQ